MGVRKFSLPNKPLVMISGDRAVYVGDARGFVYEIEHPFTSPRTLFQARGPVSALVLSKGFYYGTWDGDVGVFEGKRINISIHMVKCMTSHGDSIYVSAGLCIYVLSRCLNIRCVYEVEHKVLSMTTLDGSLYCGMGVPFVARVEDGVEVIGRSRHETSILCMSGEYTGSADGRVLRQNYTVLEDAEEIYKGDGWVRSIHSRYLFSDGKRVMGNLLGNNGGGEVTAIYSHDSDVVGVSRIEDKIVSIGLDYCYRVFDVGLGVTQEEERELLELMSL